MMTRRGDATMFERDGFRFFPLAVPSLGATELAVWALEVPAGAVSEPHSMDREEVFVLQAGGLMASIGDETFALSAGDTLTVPPHALFQIRNERSEVAHATVCTSAGMQAIIDGKRFRAPWTI